MITVQRISTVLKLYILFVVILLIFCVLSKNVYAAISFVGSAEGSSVPNADTTVDLSGIGLQEGDLVIVSAGIGDDDNAALDLVVNSSGYTELINTFSQDDDDVNLGVWWKIMDAVPDTSVVVEGSTGGTDSSLAVVVMAFRGVDSTTPFDVARTSNTGINTFNPDPPSIDHNNPSGVWIVIAGASGHLLGGSGTYTFPTGYTTNAIDRGQDDTNDITVGMGYRSSGVSDPENPGVMTHTGTVSATNSWAAVTMALRPATNSSPTVTTSAASNVSITSATLNGNITATGGTNPTERGFAWGTNSTLSGGNTATTTESGSFSTGAFTKDISGLLAGITYYFRAYATNSAGTGYGSIQSFTASAASATPSRRMRLFEGFTIKFISGKIILY